MSKFDQVTREFGLDDWSVSVLPLPNGKQLSVLAGFCEGDAIANLLPKSGASHKPCRWQGGVRTEFGFARGKDLLAAAARGNDVVGYWSTSIRSPLHWCADENGSMVATELPKQGYSNVEVRCTGGGAHAGIGYRKMSKGQTQMVVDGLLWRDGELIRLQNPQGETSFVDVDVDGTDGEWQVGALGSMVSKRATLWRGSSDTAVDLGGGKDSHAYAVRDGEQVGAMYKDDFAFPVLWRGTAGSVVELAPKGFAGGYAWDCAGGIQVGQLFQNGHRQALPVLWRGTERYLGLHEMLPESLEWSGAGARVIEVEGDQVRILSAAWGHVKEKGITVEKRHAIVWKARRTG
jgi:hypothetical protein